MANERRYNFKSQDLATMAEYIGDCINKDLITNIGKIIEGALNHKQKNDNETYKHQLSWDISKFEQSQTFAYWALWISTLSIVMSAIAIIYK